jgi:hypothetical protein
MYSPANPLTHDFLVYNTKTVLISGEGSLLINVTNLKHSENDSKHISVIFKEKLL